jgi:hypothetical protein
VFRLTCVPYQYCYTGRVDPLSLPAFPASGDVAPATATGTVNGAQWNSIVACALADCATAYLLPQLATIAVGLAAGTTLL